jgi:predicted regulator of Ras-like GTPase activity (Roadblock/LC7/MglB family)
MDFKAGLEELVSGVEGAIGAGLVGLDGLVIDQVSGGRDFDLTVAGAEYATIIKNAFKATQGFGLGRTGEILIAAEKATLVVMPIGEEYFAALVLEPAGNLGRGRLELKRHVQAFERALA